MVIWTMVRSTQVAAYARQIFQRRNERWVVKSWNSSGVGLVRISGMQLDIWMDLNVSDMT